MDLVEATPALVTLAIHTDKPKYDYKAMMDYLSVLKVSNVTAHDRIVRKTSRTDFFFFCLYVLKLPVMHPFLMARCYEIQDNLFTDMLYLWAREHWKTTLISFARSIWLFTLEPSYTIGCFSNNTRLSKAILRKIKYELETNEDLRRIWTDVFYMDPKKEREKKWSEDDGLFLRQTEGMYPAFGAYGLIDSMPTGFHFRRKIYDDIVDINNVSTQLMVDKVEEAFRISDNLGNATHGYVDDIIGTRYKYGDLYEKLKEELNYKESFIPSEVDASGEPLIGGIPVYMTRESLDSKLKKQKIYTYSAQMLQRPMASEDVKFKKENLKFYEEPSEVAYYYLLCDPACDPRGRRSKEIDYTTMFLLGLTNRGTIEIIDMIWDKIGLLDKWEYLKYFNSRYNLMFIGYEEYGTSSDIDFFKIKMDEERIYLNIKKLKGNTVGDSKFARIMRLQPEFETGKIVMPKTLVRVTKAHGAIDLISSFITEYERYPNSKHDDILDCLSRICDPDVQRVFPPLSLEPEKVAPVKYNPLFDESFEIRECYWGDLA